MPDAIRLNIGAGNTQIPGFTPIDAKLGHDACKLDFPSASVDEVYSSHCLEHIHHTKTADALREWVRVLKPGGRIRIAIPNFDAVLSNARTDQDMFNSSYLSAWLHAGFDGDTDRHQAFILRQDLEAHLRRNGIEDIGPWVGEYDDQARVNPMTLNVGGYKRETKIPRNPKVVMVLSTPRFGPVDTAAAIAESCRALGWVYYPSGGTEWGKGLECGIQDVIAKFNPDYIMCLDYDGVWETADMQKLLDFMQANPDVAAAWPAQAHRHKDLPLGVNPEGAAQGVYDFSGDFTEMWSGHFGCTMIRRQVFDTIPHPWFWSIPNQQTGDWQNSSDADITFWRSCTLYGLKVGQLNTVQIGHLEWCVKWMAPKSPSGMLWQPIQHYRQSGRPSQAMFDGAYWVERAKKNASAKAAIARGESPPIHPPNPRPVPDPEPVKTSDPSESIGGRLAAPPGAGTYRAPTQIFPESQYFKPLGESAFQGKAHIPASILNGQE